MTFVTFAAPEIRMPGGVRRKTMIRIPVQTVAHNRILENRALWKPDEVM